MQILVCWFWVVFQARPVNLECDRSMNPDLKEGNIGDVGIFSWIGVLRTKIFTATENKVALTGIVLVRDKYCIGHADDVAKIPKRNLEDTTRAMFIPSDQKPWYSKVKDYMMHPEYDYSTMNSIALVELDLEDVPHFPITSICGPAKKFDTTQLYVIGYTDENKLLEKVLYRVDFASLDTCKEFYERQQPLMVDRHEVRNTICVIAQNNKKQCEWDNGMVMVSNSTGIWTLIGFSLQGSCSVPSRFIDLTKYLNWIETSSSLEPEEIYRKSGGDTRLQDDNFSKESQDTELRKVDNTGLDDSNKEREMFEKPLEVIESTLDNTSKQSHDKTVGDSKFHKNKSRRGSKPNVYSKLNDDMQFYGDQLSKEPQDTDFMDSGDDTESHKDYVYKELDDHYARKSETTTEFHKDSSSEIKDNQSDVNFRIQRIARNAISINFNTDIDPGDCTISKAIVYSESMPLRSNKTNIGIVLLKIPVIDLKYKDYSCVSLEVRPYNRSAYLRYNIKRNNPDQLKKASPHKVSTHYKRRRHNRKKILSDILYLKLRFVFAADFIYLVYGKENTSIKVLDSSKGNASAEATSNEKVELIRRNSKSRSQTDLAKRNVKLKDNNGDIKQTLKMINSKTKETIVPLALHYKVSEDDGFLNSIKSVIVTMYRNYMTVNIFLNFLIICIILYMLVIVFLRKGYVRF